MRRPFGASIGVCFFAGCALIDAPTQAALTPIQTNRLPPAAEVKVDFYRDIKPIFEGTCWRCHGPERPRSHFRLDNRQGALKGGDNGIDILPGNSAGSPLIHYVARLVPDLEMPPEGKGQPLTPEQVGLLRAWIDQGVLWAVSNTVPELAFAVSPTLREIAVHGDGAKFGEIEGVPGGVGGGLDRFSVQQQIGPDEKFSVEGHALFPENDLQLKLALEKTDVGFIRGGLEEWRRYYDDAGGFYRPFSTPFLTLNRDLHLDVGRAWIDFGLTLPHWPQMVLGYEYQFKEGSKSTLEWGAVTSNGSTKNIYPASESISEHTHILKFDLTHEFHDWRLEERARVEFYHDSVVHHDAASYTLGPAPDTLVNSRDGSTHVQGLNTVRLERHVTDGVFLSAGYLYSRYDGNASFNQTTTDSMGTPVAGTFWSSDQIHLDRETHSFSVAGLFGPWKTLSLSVGVQPEWTRQEGFGNVHFDEGNPDVPQSFLLEPAIIQANYDTRRVSQEASLRSTILPRTVLFAEGRWAQESVGQTQEETANGSAPSVEPFMTRTDFTHDTAEYRAGFNTSPWSFVSLSAHYRRASSDTDFQNQFITIANEDYSAFIRFRNIDTDETQTKLALRPANWVKLTLTYQIVDTDYSMGTSPVPGLGGSLPISLGGPIFAGSYRARVYGFNVTVTPVQRLYVSGNFTYSDSRAATAQNGDPSIVPYKGGVYSVAISTTYALDKATDLHAAYSFSQANYGEDNVAAGLPLGLDYTRHSLMVGVTRRLSSRVTTQLRYGFYRYSEPSTGGSVDYTAHGVFATLALKWP
ncbi:Planctomycete cytochrome C [Verrucomicrobia bacterium]|nr:Planctomycete cytochrome C [Verrucomicrobiota bacterium]